MSSTHRGHRILSIPSEEELRIRYPDIPRGLAKNRSFLLSTYANHGMFLFLSYIRESSFRRMVMLLLTQLETMFSIDVLSQSLYTSCLGLKRGPEKFRLCEVGV